MIVVGIVMMMTTETGNVAALANTNLSQAFRYGIYSNDDIEEVCGCASFRIEYFTANIFYYPVHTLSSACLYVCGWVDHYLCIS